jgi:hypothetical protein
MCTLVILRRPGHDWPLILAANRDEMIDRPWQPPARHWPDRRQVLAGLDELAGGTWLGLNDDGVAAAVLNRRGSLGPEGGKRSRGELVLEALDHGDAEAAAAALLHLDPRAYRTFNLVIAAPLAGLSMLTAGDLDDRTSPRIRTHLPRFRDAEAPLPDPEDSDGGGDWTAWRDILASRHYDTEDGPFAAMSLVTDMGFGTVSSSLIALPAAPASFGQQPVKPIWMFAPDRPDIAEYQVINLRT